MPLFWILGFDVFTLRSVDQMVSCESESVCFIGDCRARTRYGRALSLLSMDLFVPALRGGQPPHTRSAAT